VPAGTPREIIQRLNAEVGRVLQAPEVRERLKSLGAEEIAGSTPEQLDALMKAETPVWSRVIKAAGIKTEEFK
jgi:tripartite-type tricarboxylate transporter receptor subunit TctC